MYYRGIAQIMGTASFKTGRKGDETSTSFGSRPVHPSL